MPCHASSSKVHGERCHQVSCNQKYSQNDVTWRRLSFLVHHSLEWKTYLFNFETYFFSFKNIKYSNLTLSCLTRRYLVAPIDGVWCWFRKIRLSLRINQNIFLFDQREIYPFPLRGDSPTNPAGDLFLFWLRGSGREGGGRGSLQNHLVSASKDWGLNQTAVGYNLNILSRSKVEKLITAGLSLYALVGWKQGKVWGLWKRTY